MAELEYARYMPLRALAGDANPILAALNHTAGALASTSAILYRTARMFACGREIPGVGTAVILGAGGPVGHAYHAGVLAALHQCGALDVREAELIVGTSAGAAIGALVRASLSGPDLLHRVCGEPLCERVQSLVRHYRLPQRPGQGRLESSHGVGEGVARDPSESSGQWRPAAASYLWHMARRPWAFRLGSFAAAMLPAGRGCLQDYAAGLSDLFPNGWPAGLWITALRAHDGQVVAFGQPGAPPVSVGVAVACSSAVPTVWKPMRIDGETYVDGGMRSALHLPLVAAVPTLQRVIVSSPLSRMPLMSRWMRSEARELRRAGIDVLAFEPGPAVTEAMGWNPLDPKRAPAVARVAYLEALETLNRIRGQTSPSAANTPIPHEHGVKVA